MPFPPFRPASVDADKKSRHARRFLYWSLAINLASLPLNYFQYTIYGFLPDIFYRWGPFSLLVSLLLSEIYALYFAIRYFFSLKFKAVYPYLIFLITSQILHYSSPVSFNRCQYYLAFQKERESLVAAFCDKSISLPKGECDTDCVELPPQWKHLSVERRTEITCGQDRNTALFFTEWGFLNSWEALMYRSDDSYPDEPHILRARSIERLGKNWFSIVR